jgi:hypothetical protein
MRIFGVLIGRRFAEVLRLADPAEIGRLSVFGSSFLMTGSFLMTAFLVLFFWLRFRIGVVNSCEAFSGADDDGGALG